MGSGVRLPALVVVAVLAAFTFAGAAQAGQLSKVGSSYTYTETAASTTPNSITLYLCNPGWSCSGDGADTGTYFLITDNSGIVVGPASGCSVWPYSANFTWCPTTGMTAWKFELTGGNDSLSTQPCCGTFTIPITVAGGEGVDSITGGNAADLIKGEAGNDSLTGGPGRDSLAGGIDSDTLNGGDGSDLLDGGDNNDTMNGGNGVDIVTYAGRPTAITVHLGVAGADDGAAIDGAAGARDNINETDVEGVIGGNANDSLWGDARTEALRIQGGPGNDMLRGGAGPNVLLGNAGNDNLAGGNDLDFFGGGIGNDVVNAVDSSSDDVDCGGGVDAASSDAVDTREGCEPNTTITEKPAKTTTQRRATFKYMSTTPGATFQCQHDGGAWLSCPTTGKTYSRLRPGTHRFKVRAKDADGTVDPTPAAYTWTVR